MPSGSRNYISVAVSGSQLIKSVTSLVLKKRKVTTIVGVFLRKAPTKKSKTLLNIEKHLQHIRLSFTSEVWRER